MPFLAALAPKGVILGNMWQTYHPSDQNSVAMVAGDTFEQGSAYYPDYNLAAPHLGDALEAHGKQWAAYVQNMGMPCNLQSSGEGTTAFSPDDEPFAQFSNVIQDGPRCVAHLRDLQDFELAINSNTLPDFAWLAANNWWDGGGRTITSLPCWWARRGC